MADEEGFFEDWPKWSKPVFALSAMILLGGVWIGIPLMSAWKLGIDSAHADVQWDYEPMIAALVAMTTATIAGIFVFMTFRIDRGTRLKAERVAKEKADEIVKEKFDDFEKRSKEKMSKFDGDSKCKLDHFEKLSTDAVGKLGEAARSKFCEFDRGAKSKFKEFEERLDESTKPEVIEKAVQDRVPDEIFRAHVETVLLANTNGEIVKEFAKERAEAMELKDLEALLRLLNETTDHVAQCAKEKRKGDRDGFWARAKRTMADWRKR